MGREGFSNISEMKIFIEPPTNDSGGHHHTTRQTPLGERDERFDCSLSYYMETIISQIMKKLIFPQIRKESPPR